MFFSQKIMYIPQSCTVRTLYRAGTLILNTSHQVGYFPTSKKQSFYSLGIFKCNFKAKNETFCCYLTQTKWRTNASTNLQEQPANQRPSSSWGLI